MKCVDGCPRVKSVGSVFRSAAPAAVVIRGVRTEVCSGCGDELPTVQGWRRLAQAWRDRRFHNRVAARRRMLREDRDWESKTG